MSQILVKYAIGNLSYHLEKPIGTNSIARLLAAIDRFAGLV